MLPTFSHLRHSKLSFHLSVIASTNPDLLTGPVEISDLLNTSCGDDAYRTLLNVSSKGVFVMWAARTDESTCWTLEAAVAFTDRFLHRRQSRSTTFTYTSSIDGEDRKRERGYRISILGLDDEAASSILLPYQDRQALEECRHAATGKHRGPATFLQRRAYPLGAGLLLLVLMFIAATLYILHHKTSDPILLPNHNGLHTSGLNELRFTYPNVNFTSWSISTGRSDASWFVRLDDGTLIPPDLADADEHKYTAWYASRYPTYAAVRDNKDYLNSTYWKHAFHTHTFLDIDHEFRVTHCVLALKRYWKAMESGRHVCPKDVNSIHIGHCFEVLETFVIPDDGGFEKPLNRSDPVVGLKKPWVVSACF